MAPSLAPSHATRISSEPLTCAPTATRTRDLLLRRHFRSVPRRCWMWPDVPFGCGENGWNWPGVALCLWRLAPRLAPRHLVSNANAQTIDTLDSSIKCVRRSTDRGERRPRDEASLLSLLASRGGVIRCPR